MEFGIFSNGLRPNRSPDAAWDEDMFEVELADQLGFREAWISEHASPAELLIARAAGTTRQIKLGAAVRLLPLYHPVQVAVEANVCDQLTHGRYQFGFGIGFFPNKMLERGIDPACGREMMLECLDLVLRCWQEPEPFDFDGRFWSGRQVAVRPKPFQQPHPPVGVACMGSRETVELAGRRGFMPLFSHLDTASRMATELASYDAAAPRSARSAVRACRMVYVSGSVAQAKKELRPTLEVAFETEKRTTPHHFERWVAPGQNILDLTFDELVEAGRYVIGDPDTVAQQLAEFYHQTGGFGVLMLHMGRDYGEREHRARSMRLFAEAVAPQLRDLVPPG